MASRSLTCRRWSLPAAASSASYMRSSAASAACCSAVRYFACHFSLARDSALRVSSQRALLCWSMPLPGRAAAVASSGRAGERVRALALLLGPHKKRTDGVGFLLVPVKSLGACVLGWACRGEQQAVGGVCGDGVCGRCTLHPLHPSQAVRTHSSWGASHHAASTLARTGATGLACARRWRTTPNLGYGADHKSPGEYSSLKPLRPGAWSRP